MCQAARKGLCSRRHQNRRAVSFSLHVSGKSLPRRSDLKMPVKRLIDTLLLPPHQTRCLNAPSIRFGEIAKSVGVSHPFFKFFSIDHSVPAIRKKAGASSLNITIRL